MFGALAADVRARLDAHADARRPRDRRARRRCAIGVQRGWPTGRDVPARLVGLLLGRGRRGRALGRCADRCRATGCSISHASGSSSTSTGCRSTGSPSSRTAACIPGYAFPLWHGFLALIAKVAHEDPERVVTHLPSILAPLAVVVAFEAGWALFRRTWAAGATAGAQVAMICFAPGMGGAYVFLALPATASRQLLVPAALALALESVRSPTRRRRSLDGGRGLVLAVVHPTYAIFLWIPFVGFLAVRLLWTRADLRTGALGARALVAPAGLFMLWLRPIVNDTRSVSPDAEELQRAFEQYGSQLVVHSDTSYNLAPEVFTRSGAVAIAALLLVPVACLAARRRWAAYVVGGSLAVFAVMLLPFLFTSLADLVSISQARRAAGFLPFAFAFAGGMGVLARLVGPILLPLVARRGDVPADRLSGRLRVRAQRARARVDRVAVVSRAPWRRSSSGSLRRRPALEAGAALASAAFLLPVVAGGLLDLRPTPLPEIATLSDGLVRAVRARRADGAVVFSDPETSFRLAAFAPVYIASAPPGHVADTEKNSPYERASDARRFLRTGDLAIPRGYGAEYVVLDRLRTKLVLDLPVVYRDERFVVYRPLAGRAPAPAAGRLDAEEVAGLEVEDAIAGSSSPFRSVLPGQAVAASARSARRDRAPLGEEREPAGLEDAQLAHDAVAAAVTPCATRAGAQLVALDAQRVRELERLRRGVERVRHRDVDAGRPVARPDTRPGRRRSSRSTRSGRCRRRRCSSSPGPAPARESPSRTRRTRRR